MAVRGRKKNAEGALALALAAGGTVEAAAAAAGLSERTAYRRLADPEFRKRVDRVRGELVERAAGRLSAIGVLAVDQLEALLRSMTAGVRLGAARTVLAHLLAANEQVLLARRIEALEQKVEQRKFRSAV